MKKSFHFLAEMRTGVFGILVCLLILASSLGSCASLIPGVLIAGEPETDENRNAFEIKDGPALMARFGYIQDIAADEDGNVYVYDAELPPPDQFFSYLLTKSLIRKISADGQVTTLAGKRGDIQGSLYPEPLIGNQKMDVDGGKLYFSNPGCVMRVNLKPDSESQKPETFFGKCLSSQEIEELKKNPEFSIGQLNTLLTVNSQHKVYVRSSKILTKQSESYVIDSDGQFTKIESRFFVASDVVNSQGHFYRVEPGLPGPGTPGKSALRKFDYEGNELDIPGVRQLSNIGGGLSVDHQDNLYMIDEGWLIKRLNPTGKIETLGQSPRIGSRDMAVNPQGTILYLADVTGVYKLALLQPSGGTP